MKLFLTLLTAICLSTAAIGQTNFFLANCNDARITLDPSIPIDNSMYNGDNDVYACPAGFNARLSTGIIGAVYHELQRNIGGTWTVEKAFRTNYRTIHYNNLQDGGIYQFKTFQIGSELTSGVYWVNVFDENRKLLKVAKLIIQK